MAVRVFDRDRPDMRMPLIAGDARLVVWPGVGCWEANMNYVVMEPGEENVPHTHPSSEDTIYVLEGRGTVRDLTHGLTLDFEADHVIHVPPGVEHQVRADRGERVVTCGGPCPADEAMLRRLGADLPPRKPPPDGAR
jgi:quercetin dioxygenase-like cupin family protein